MAFHAEEKPTKSGRKQKSNDGKKSDRDRSPQNESMPLPEPEAFDESERMCACLEEEEFGRERNRTCAKDTRAPGEERNKQQ